MNKINMQKIPDGWIHTKLGQIAEIKYGKGLPVKQFKDSGYPVYGANGVIGYYDKFAFEDEQLLISCRGANSGTINFSPKKCFVTNNSLIVDFVVESVQLRKTLFYFLQAANKERLVTGTAQPQVTINNAVELELLLPPLNEQHRIIAKIEELFSELDNGIENLKTAQQQLKVYRQALLKHAFEGKLTAQWREQNQDKLETAEALLKRISQERAQRYQQQLADWAAAGKQGSKPKALKTLTPFTTEELAELPELPNSWAWIKFGDLIESSQNGISKRSGLEGKEVVVLRLADIAEQKISVNSTRKIMLTEKELANYRLNKNDLICIRVNGSPDLVGRMVTIEDDTDMAYCDHFIRYRLLEGNCNFKYVASYFNTVPIRRYIDLNKVSSAGQNTVNQEMLGSISVALCGSEEQAIIVSMLEEKLSEVDYMDKTITASVQQAEALRQSILKKAFSGQLVAQDANDEPASELMSRIRKEQLTNKIYAKS